MVAPAVQGGEPVTFSGILVNAAPGDLAPLANELERLPGTRVHQQDPATGRLVLTLEAPTVNDEVDGLRRIQQVPGVISANLVYHRIGAGDPAAADGSSAPQGESR
jgi:nitrate reductase NapAB chaperone NapD